MKEIKTIVAQQPNHVNATTSAGNGKINPIYRPKWTKVSSALDTNAQTLSIVVKGNASENQTINGANINYSSEVTTTLTAEDILVYVDGELEGDTNKNGIIDAGETPAITKTVSTASPSATSAEVTHTITLSNFGEALRQEGKEFTEWSGNIAIKIGGRGKDESTYNANVLTDKYGNESMMETDLDGTNDDGSWVNVIFKDGSIDHNASGTMFTDFVKPEFTYEYSNTTIDHNAKKVTVVFSVTDKYFNNTTLATDTTASNIIIKLDGITATNATKTLTKLSDITATVNGTASTKIGEKYKLEVTNLDQGDADKYSGIMTLAFPADIVTDKSGNKNLAKSITIGIDDPTTDDGHDDNVIVDVVAPIWKAENISIDGTTKTVNVDLIATDKYLTGVENSTLTTDDITLTVDGNENANTAITKTLSTPTFSENATTGLKEIKYTLTLTNWEEATLQSGKSFLEYSGTTEIKVKEGTVRDDASGETGAISDGSYNTNEEQEFTIGHVDFIKPRIEKVATSIDTTNKTQTIIFNVIDKYLDTTNTLTADEISVYVDQEVTTGITKTLTRLTANDVSVTVNGTSQVVSQQYKLVLSNFEQSRTTIDTAKNFADWSGTVSIEIAESAITDKGNKPEGSTGFTSANTNEKTTIVGDFADFVKPQVTYQYVTGDINYNVKTFTMKFNITDKYFTESTLATEYANATTDEAKLAVLQNYLTIKVDGDDVTTDNSVIKRIIAIEDVKATKAINKTVDGTVKTGLTNQVIGKSFTLEISQLQQDSVNAGDEYLDYSGVVTVAVKADLAKDNGPTGNGTNKNGNIATTITSGVELIGSSSSDSGTVVDTVDPIWQNGGTVTAQLASQTATISVKGTDKYLKTIGLNPSDITVEVNGVVKTSADGITVTVTEDNSATLTYGKQYIIRVDGYASNASQLKVILKEGLITDESGNTSKETSFVLFSSLKATSSEKNATSPFLGNTNLQRQKIEKIIFQDNLEGINNTKWDVTELQDESIWGWYTTDSTTGNYTVFIGSDIIINGNVNSSYLFSYIGYDSTCKVTGNTGATDGTEKPLIENLDLLHVDGVTDMSCMFFNFGTKTMKSLDLGNTFDTSNVTKMTEMFTGCGRNNMETLNLGTKFNTSNVTNMNYMFNLCGYAKLTSLDLSSGTDETNTTQFDTSKVTNMSSMFVNCGYTALTSLNLGNNFDTQNVTSMSRMFTNTGYTALTGLNLGDKFDTSKVTNMYRMFFYCGYKKMTTLNLGDKFNTAKVTDMQKMFDSCGSDALTSLDLGDLFYTTSATDMYKMFNGCGSSAMTALDLGPAFTKIPNGQITKQESDYQSWETDKATNYKSYDNMFTTCGSTGAVIYAPESIFSNEKNFKTDANSSTTISYERGIINPIYKPEFTKISSTVGATNDEITVVVKGNANKEQTIGGVNINYHSDVVNSMTADDITVYVDGEKAENVTKQIVSAVSSTNETTGKTEITYTIKLTNFDQGTRQTDASGNLKKYNEWSGNISLQFAKDKLKDMYGGKFNASGNFENIAGNGNISEYTDSEGTKQSELIKDETQYEQNTENVMFADLVKPVFTYEYSNTTIDHGTKTVTVVFDVADKYFNASGLTAENITVKLGGEVSTNATKTLTKLSDLTATINGVENKKIGERYQLVVTNLDQGEGDDYSGIMTMSFPAGLITDKSGNSNIAKTITIGIDDPTTDDGHDTGVIVDVVDPIWKVENINIDNTNKELTAELVVTDKYLTGIANSTLTTNDITVKVDGDANANTAIIKSLSTPTFAENTDTGMKEIRYTLTLSNWEETTKQSGKSFLEYSGTTAITIAEGVVRDDASGVTGTTSDGGYNTSNEQTFTLGHVDFVKPRIEKVSSTIDATAKTETIIFNVIDKYIDTTKTLTANDIKVYVDGEEATITKTLTRITSGDSTATIDGTSQVISQQYKLELSDFEKAVNSKNYKDWSGTVTIEVAKDKVQDKVITSDTNTSGGNLNDVTTLNGDFVDFVNPSLQYAHQSVDIDKTGKTYKMTFTVTDKYYKSGELTIDDLTVSMQNGQYDSNGVPIIYNLKNEPVTMLLQSTDFNASNVAITNESGNVETVSSVKIGHTYTLTISNLEQFERKTGLTTADYSGIVTVAVAGDKVLDKGPSGNSTSSNGNIATTITSGVNIPGGTSPDDAEVVDVVDPIWEKVSSSAYAFDPEDKTTSTATVTFRGTDTYFANSTLTSDNIKVLVNGTEVTSGITKTLSSATSLTEQRKDFDTNTTTTKQYGVEYTLTIKGFAQNANQIKVQLPANSITDESGNGNKQTDLIVYNALKETETETSGTSAFIANSSIQRQNIDNITFVDNIPSTVYDKVTSSYVDTTAWDVSAMQDKSILAWYTTNANGTLKVYIGSDDEIFANQNSSYLFACIGYSNKCTSEETITNLSLLNVKSTTKMSAMFLQTGRTSMKTFNLGATFDTSNVTDMKSMFEGTGSSKMTTLDLGENFDTTNVTNMSYMFASTGYSEMTALDLGEKFNTINVTNMSSMFDGTGSSKMTTLNLRANFDTRNVTDMSYMFYETGSSKLTELNLGTNFDTTNVENMESMFDGAGLTSMTTLNLGEKFDTTNVKNMECMFYETGYTAMTSLDLGDKFFTTNAESMASMFYETGATAMTTLDLGPAFTRIASTNSNMFISTGKSGSITIYASEQIYLDKNNFKIDTNATTLAIGYTRGTINPKYRTEWVKESSTINETNKNIAITLRGRTNAEAGVDFTSNVQSTLTTDNIHVYIDGEEVPTTSTLTKSLATATTTTNATTGANDVLQVLTISNMEETLRQSGKNFKEWSGNISIKIDKKTLKDTTYNNQNIQAIDTTGEMIDIEIKDTAVDKNTNGTMFTDYINPEFTYEYFNTETDTDANTVIDYESKTVTVVFDVTDKFFKQANITANDITIKLDGEEPDWTKATKTLTKKTLGADQVAGDITYKANGDIYYNINGTPTKIGERYELVVTGLETQNGVGYSGAMTMSFPAGELNADGTVKTGIVDKSGNLSLAKTITIGIDDPENHPEHDEEAIVDVVNPLWTGPHNINTIDRANKTVKIQILGSDKYYATDVFAETIANGTINTALSKIKVYVDGVEQTAITKTLTVLSTTELQTIKTNADLQDAAAEDVKVGYTLTLGNYGDISGETTIVIEAGTITDQSGNENIETTIPVGNITWVETNEPLNEGDTGYPRYHAFREDIVDFINPAIKYQYSEIQVDTDGDGVADSSIMANPEIDYEAKTLTVKFTVTDKYLVQSSIMNTDGTLNTDNVKIKISTLNNSGVEEFKDITDEGITTTITSAEITDGYEYTLTIKDFEQIYNNKGNYMDYSGIVQLAFAEGQIDDTSGNKNIATTITIDTGTGDDPNSGVIVDVINPIIEKTAENLSVNNSSNSISRDTENETGTVTILIKGTDKYLSTGTLQNAENVAKMKVKVIKPDGTTVMPDTITKTVTQVSKQATSITYRITLGNFEENEGITSIIIPEGVITDTSGNGNLETEILVGNSTWTEAGDSAGEYDAFKNSIVDFTMPKWEYATSSITRNRDGETGTVTVKILGSDIYYLKDTLTANSITTYVANSENPEQPITTITKSLEKITNTDDLEGADTGYYLTLGNFGTYDGQVKITIAENTMQDTSGNGNKLTEILVGNPNWVETDIEDNAENPKYTAFRNSIVDFIKPTIKYQYTADVNPIVDQESKTFTMTFDATDTNFLENTLTVDDIQIFVDDVDVTGTLTKTLTSADIPDENVNGIRYTLTLSNFELPDILTGDSYKKHSGKIELVIAEGKVKDTSGNTNIETRIIVDNDDGDDANNYVRVDFINPKLYYVDKHISWDNRYATVTIAGTDRFYDFNTKLDPADIKLYQENKDGEYVEISDLSVSINPVKTDYGYNFVIRLDDFEEEYKMKISIPAGKIADLDGHYNEATDIIVGLDNKRPVWKYMGTDTSEFESEGKISFNVKGYDKFLDLTNSGLEDGEVSVYRDRTDITSSVGITITEQGQDENEKSKSYKIDVTGLTETGTYSLVFKEKTLIDEFLNESATTTITFSKSIISSNTDNYQKVTYYASSDFELTHQAYVHELMSVNTTGTNAENTTFRPSTIGEIYDEGKNTLFAEPFTYASGTQLAYSFKGWALADEDGFIVDKTTGKPLSTSEGSVFDETKATIYGLYDEIPETAKADDNMVHLKAVWQQAKVIFVSSGSGNNSKDGLSPDTPVKDLQTAYNKLGNTGTASTNIIVIMDEVEWNSSTKLTGNATITSLYAGVDYKADGAELKISSNLEVDGDIKFDNIKLYSNSTTVSNGNDYLANGEYTNMLITNYGDVTLGRRISTPDSKYTFGAVIGGNYKTETKTGEIGIHTVIVESGKYNNMVIGSALESGGQTTTAKYISHQVVIGNMKDSAISRNDNLTITGYVSMGELEDRCYPYNNSGSQDTTNAYTRTYGITKLYSGTFTGENKFAKAAENASIYLRPMNGFTDGATKFEMYGGNITGNVYAGARMATSGTSSTEQIYQNDMKFYGGQITGNIFGHGSNDTSTGDSKIELAGRFEVIGNVFGGSNATTIGQGKVTGNTEITLNTASAKVDGNIYGGSNGIISGTSIDLNNGLISKDTDIVINAGTVTGDIFGGGYNCGVTGSANIIVNNGAVAGNIYGGAYQNQVKTEANIVLSDGTVNSIYGGNVLTTQSQQNNDSLRHNVNITIDGEDLVVNGSIFGSGKHDKVGTVTINLISCATTPTVYGGSDGSGLTDVVNINLQGMTVSEIYGGSNENGTVTTANINLISGTVTDVYGGGYGGTTTTSNINLGVTTEGTTTGNVTATSIYGGPNTSGTVGTSNVILKSGTVTNVFGGGNSAAIGTANVTLDGITVDTIYGGSKNSGIATKTDVILKSGRVTEVYGGGLGAGVTNANVTQQGATVETIYGGNRGRTGSYGNVTNATVNIENSKVTNVFGGSYGSGTTINSTINIRGTSLITKKIYGGGCRSEQGTSDTNGSTTINISGGTINKDIYGGSEDSRVYGTTNVNIGKDVVTDSSQIAGNIIIKGNIYGAGSTINTDYSYIGVYGNTHISLANSTSTPITFSGNIFGAGKSSNYSTNNTSSDESTIRLKNFGTASNSYMMTSIQRTGKVYIGNSYIELIGASDNNNYYKNTMYTLNRVTNGLAIHDNTTLYTRRGFNMVGGFDSYLTNADGSTTKETISISGNTVTKNVDNRLYTFEGINLIFAKQEGEIYDRTNEDLWGDVNGMAFFGMYRINRTSFKKEYDIYAPNYSGGAVENFFANGTYIEGRHKANHDTTVDGFYTNVGDYSNLSNITVVPQVIDVTDYGTYYDWIIGADIVNYDVGPIIASTYSTWSTAELKLDYKYEQGAMYTLNRVSVNALDTNVNLINPLEIPTIATSENANNVFGLTMEADKTGWIQSGVTNLYTDNNGSFEGNTVYKTDNSSEPGTLIFKIFNSINVSETKDIGNVNIILTGKTRTGEDASAGNIFRVVIAVSLQSLYEQPSEDGYISRFTDSIETELNYTTDSSVDITYVMYKTELADTIYASGDYRVLSSTVQLPAGTKITLKDYGQGDNVNAVYYYQVPTNTSYDATETVDGKTRYLYKLSHFKYIGTNISSVTDFNGVGDYANENDEYYHAGTEASGYVFEKYDISIDLIDSNINTNQLEQETYLQLRDSDGRLKLDNGDKTLTYNLYNNNATKTETISNEGQSYSVYENLTIPFTFDATLLEKVVGADGTVSEGSSGANISERIQDTKYYSKKIGLAIEITDDDGIRVRSPEVQNLKLTDVNDSTISYTAGSDSVIRVPLSDGLAKIQNKYKLSLTQYNVPAGIYKVKVYFFTSDDGLHYGNETILVKEFNITFINRLLGLAGVESTDGSRIISKSTGLNLEGNSGLDLTVKVGSPTDDTNIRAELYKRNPTYTVTESESGEEITTYAGTQYTQVDLSQYLEGTWETPEDQGLVTQEGCIEYMVMPKETYSSAIDIKTVEFKKTIKDTIGTGEYKLVLKACYDNTVIQTITKTFIVTE